MSDQNTFDSIFKRARPRDGDFDQPSSKAVKFTPAILEEFMSSIAEAYSTTPINPKFKLGDQVVFNDMLYQRDAMTVVLDVLVRLQTHEKFEHLLKNMRDIPSHKYIKEIYQRIEQSERLVRYLQSDGTQELLTYLIMQSNVMPLEDIIIDLIDRHGIKLFDDKTNTSFDKFFMDHVANSILPELKRKSDAMHTRVVLKYFANWLTFAAKETEDEQAKWHIEIDLTNSPEVAILDKIAKSVVQDYTPFKFMVGSKSTITERHQLKVAARSLYAGLENTSGYFVAYYAIQVIPDVVKRMFESKFKDENEIYPQYELLKKFCVGMENGPKSSKSIVANTLAKGALILKHFTGMRPVASFFLDWEDRNNRGAQIRNALGWFTTSLTSTGPRIKYDGSMGDTYQEDAMINNIAGLETIKSKRNVALGNIRKKLANIGQPIVDKPVELDTEEIVIAEPIDDYEQIDDWTNNHRTELNLDDIMDQMLRDIDEPKSNEPSDDDQVVEDTPTDKSQISNSFDDFLEMRRNRSLQKRKSFKE